jgi:hypothetical protein
MSVLCRGWHGRRRLAVPVTAAAVSVVPEITRVAGTLNVVVAAVKSVGMPDCIAVSPVAASTVYSARPHSSAFTNRDTHIPGYAVQGLHYIERGPHLLCFRLIWLHRLS